MSSTTQPTRLVPPAQVSPLDDIGNHSRPWADYHQSVADQLTALPAQMRKGVTDGSDAQAGDIGEYLTASASVPLTNNTLANVVSISLTAGDWDVSGNVAFAAGSGPHFFFGAGIDVLDTFTSATFPSAALNMAISTATHRRNVTGATTVWVVAEAGFTGGTVTASGTIRARRAR